jgi:hypothetical protein
VRGGGAGCEERDDQRQSQPAERVGDEPGGAQRLAPSVTMKGTRPLRRRRSRT